MYKCIKCTSVCIRATQQLLYVHKDPSVTLPLPQSPSLFRNKNQRDPKSEWNVT